MLGRYFVDPANLVKISLSTFFNIERMCGAAAETVVLVNHLPRIAATLIGTAPPVAGDYVLANGKYLVNPAK